MRAEAVADDVAHLTVFLVWAPRQSEVCEAGPSAAPRCTTPCSGGCAGWRRGARALLMAVFERAGAVPVAWARLRRGAPGVGAPAPVQVPDAGLRARLRPAHALGSRRVLVSSDWYRALRKPHVDLVTAAVDEVTPDGVRTVDGALHPADVVVLATGFEPDVFVTPMKVFGRDGRELSDEWRDGAAAHLGIAVPGFPNLFLVHGPHTALRAGSVVHMIECAGALRTAGGPPDRRGHPHPQGPAPRGGGRLRSRECAGGAGNPGPRDRAR